MFHTNSYKRVIKLGLLLTDTAQCPEYVHELYGKPSKLTDSTCIDYGEDDKYNYEMKLML